jgi:hypothetical protein
MRTRGAVPPEFDQFWAAYPRRVGRKKAVEAFSRAIKKTTLATMLEALAWQTKQPQWLKEQGAFIPYAQGWLNGERWEDEPFQAPPSRGTGGYDTTYRRLCASCKQIEVSRLGDYCAGCRRGAGIE